MIGAGFVAILGLASAFAWSFESLAIMRCLVGIGIGGLSVPFDILAEFVPPIQRGRALMAVEFFWSVGTLFTAGLAWGLLEDLGWRWFVALCSVPVLLALAGFMMMPESPHWLVTQGRQAEALRVLQRAAVLNHRPPLPDDTVLEPASTDPAAQQVTNPIWTLGLEGETDTDAPQSTDAPASDPAEAGHPMPPPAPHSDASPAALFRRPLLWTTLRLFVVWVSFSFSYYGVLLILPEVLSGGEDSIDYTALLISSSAEVVACCIGLALIDTVGRTRTSGATYILCGGFMGLMMLAGLSPAVVILLSMLARGAIFIGSSTTWVLTPELFPT